MCSAAMGADERGGAAEPSEYVWEDEREEEEKEGVGRRRRKKEGGRGVDVKSWKNH